MSNTCYRHPSHPARVSCQRCEKSICPSCMVTASVGFQCPECAGVKREAVSKPQVFTPGNDPRVRTQTYDTTPISGRAPVTFIIILINLVVYILSVRQSGQNLELSEEFTSRGNIGYEYGLIELLVSEKGEWWRIFTSGFLHGGLFHILFNMLFFWFIGRQLEHHFGSVKFALLYLSSIVGSSFLVLFLSTDLNSVTVGASGGIYGLMGAFLILAKFHTGKFLGSFISIILALNIGFGVISFLFGRDGISWQGHLGGLLTGSLVGFCYLYLAKYMGNGKYSRFFIYSLPIIIGGLLFLGSLLIAESLPPLPVPIQIPPGGGFT